MTTETNNERPDDVHWAHRIAEKVRLMEGVDEIETNLDCRLIAANEFHFYTYDDDFPAFRVLVEPVAAIKEKQ